MSGTVALAPPAQAAGNDMFHPFTTTMPGSNPANVAIGDLTGDGRPDVVMTTDYYFDPAHDFSLFVYPQRADGSLGAPTQIATGAAYGSGMGIALADLDGDGDLDAAVSTTAGVQIYRQEAGGLSYSWTVPTGDAEDVRLTDLNGDRLADLVANTRDGAEIWWQVAGDFTRGPVLGTDRHVEVDTGDVTGDGLPDVVAATNTGVEVYAQQAGHTFAGAVTYDSGGLNGWTTVRGLAVGDTNGDGRADVHLSVGGNAPNSWVITRFQLSDGSLAKPYVRASDEVPEALEAADVTGDGRPDLVVVHSGFDRLGVYDSTPGTSTAEAVYDYDSMNWGPPQHLAVGDVNGDGLPDVVGANDLDGLVVMLHAAPGADITAPNTTITSGPSYTLRSRTATFGFAADEPSTFSCSMDAATWAPCTSPVSYGGLAQGSHRFQVRATDTAGNVEAVPAASSFTVDGPDTTITSPALGTVQSTSATFSFSGGAGTASYDCAVDNGAWSTCTSPVTYTGMTAGSHTFRVRAVSADGLVDSTPAQSGWKVDGPDTTITSGPTGTVQSQSATFAFSGATGTASYQCLLDDGGWQQCTSPVTYGALATGTSHAFKVRAVSANGLVDSTPAVRSWNVDAAADLAVTMTGAPSPVRKNGTLTWTTTVTNAGPQAASSVTLTQGLPSGFTFVSATAVPSASTSAAGSCTASGSPATVRCTLGSMNPGFSWTVTVQGTVTATKGSLASTAVASTSTWDLTAANDSASAAVTIGNGR